MQLYHQSHNQTQLQQAQVQSPTGLNPNDLLLLAQGRESQEQKYPLEQNLREQQRDFQELLDAFPFPESDSHVERSRQTDSGVYEGKLEESDTLDEVAIEVLRNENEELRSRLSELEQHLSAN
jgi:hypothetical protein